MSADAKIEAAKHETRYNIGKQIFFAAAITAIVTGLGYLAEIGVFNNVGLGEIVETNQTLATVFGAFGMANCAWAVYGAVLMRMAENDAK